ncbi:MAG: cation:proton antiporter [Pseudomonadota bacterium]
MISFFEDDAGGFLVFAVNLSLVLVLAAFFLAFVRLVRGPSLPDRIMALDLLVFVGIVFIANFTLATMRFVYLDIAIALGLVSFLATLAFARYVERRGPVEGGK